MGNMIEYSSDDEIELRDLKENREHKEAAGKVVTGQIELDTTNGGDEDKPKKTFSKNLARLKKSRLIMFWWLFWTYYGNVKQWLTTRKSAPGKKCIMCGIGESYDELVEKCHCCEERKRWVHTYCANRYLDNLEEDTFPGCDRPVRFPAPITEDFDRNYIIMNKSSTCYENLLQKIFIVISTILFILIILITFSLLHQLVKLKIRKYHNFYWPDNYKQYLKILSDRMKSF